MPPPLCEVIICCERRGSAFVAEVPERCVIFELADSALEVDEDMQGWEQLVNQLPAHLRGTLVYTDWFGAVAFPAFKANEKTIFEPWAKRRGRPVRRIAGVPPRSHPI